MHPTAAHRAAVAKYIVTNNAVEVALAATALVGNPGLLRRNALERHLRNVMHGRIHTPQDDVILAAAGRAALAAVAPTTCAIPDQVGRFSVHHRSWRNPMSAVSTELYEVRPASPVLGAEIVGVDLAGGVDELDGRSACVRTSGSTRCSSSVASTCRPTRTSRRCGSSTSRSTIRSGSTATTTTASSTCSTWRRPATPSIWHVGGMWRTPPFNIESLTYQVVPDVGGKTLWADLQAAYDGLSAAVQQLLESVSAVYSAYPGDGTTYRPAVTETVEHPVVRTHRHTGRKGLFLSSSAQRLTGIEPAEGAALLPFLLAHASSPNYSVSFGWQPGDFVIWDNLATWHFAVNDYDGPRVYRKVIGG